MALKNINGRVIAFVSIALLLQSSVLKETKKPLTFKDLNEHILCEARKTFNKDDNYKFSFQYGKGLISDHFGFDISCSKRLVDSIVVKEKTARDDIKRTYRYDRNNNLIQQGYIYGNSKEKITTFKYYKFNNLLESKNPDDTITYQYNGLNFVTTKTMSNGLVFRNSQDKNREIYERHYNGNIDLKEVRHYDQKHRLVSTESIWIKDDYANYKYNYFYNEAGDIIKKVDSSRSVSISIREYNKYGFIIKDSLINRSRHIFTTHYTYDIHKDEYGTTIQQNILYPDSSGGPLIYVFDEYGNWIMKKEFFGKNLYRIEERTISYR